MEHDLAGSASENSPAQENGRPHGCWLPVVVFGFNGLLVEAQQVEGEEHRQKRRFGCKKALHAEAVGVEFRFEFFDPLLNDGPLVVVAPERERILSTGVA